MSNDEPGRRSRARDPVPRLRMRCQCGQNLADITDLADRRHPRYAGAMDDDDDRYLISARIPVPDPYRSQDPATGLWHKTWALRCRCGRNHQLRQSTIAAAWRRIMTRGTDFTAIAGRDL